MTTINPIPTECFIPVDLFQDNLTFAIITDFYIYTKLCYLVFSSK